MPSRKPGVSWGRAALRLHRFLAISGGLALVLWGGSGLLHVVMTNFGPQQARFRPPAQTIDLNSARPIGEMLQRAEIPEAAAIRIVVGDGESLLQVTEEQDRPRRYFDLETGEELERLQLDGSEDSGVLVRVLG